VTGGARPAGRPSRNEPVAAPAPDSSAPPGAPSRSARPGGDCPARRLLPEVAGARCVVGGRANPACQRRAPRCSPRRRVPALASPRGRRASRRLARFHRSARCAPGVLFRYRTRRGGFWRFRSPCHRRVSRRTAGGAAPGLRDQPGTRERPGGLRSRSAFRWRTAPPWGRRRPPKLLPIDVRPEHGQRATRASRAAGLRRAALPRRGRERSGTTEAAHTGRTERPSTRMATRRPGLLERAHPLSRRPDRVELGIVHASESAPRPPQTGPRERTRPWWDQGAFRPQTPAQLESGVARPDGEGRRIIHASGAGASMNPECARAAATAARHGSAPPRPTPAATPLRPSAKRVTREPGVPRASCFKLRLGNARIKRKTC
jgi:hypothetical protein